MKLNTRSKAVVQRATKSVPDQLAELELLYRSAPVGLCLMDTDLRFVRINDRLAAINGVSVAEHIGRYLHEVLPDMAPKIEPLYRRVIKTGRPVIDMEVGGTTPADPDRPKVWLVSYHPVRTPDRRLLGISTVVRDITDVKEEEQRLEESEAQLIRSQEKLERLAGKLINAQEEERRRIACELHDDLSQRLATLAMDVGSLGWQRDSGAESFRKQVAHLQAGIAGISGHLHNVIRQLHPSILDELGVVRAIQSECRLAAERAQLKIEQQYDRVPENLSRELSLCLYRVAQEALRNIAKHSHAAVVTVVLVVKRREIAIIITDDGIGFNAEEEQSSRGLGLQSMEERAKICGGTLSVRTSPGGGATVEVRLPLK